MVFKKKRQQRQQKRPKCSNRCIFFFRGKKKVVYFYKNGKLPVLSVFFIILPKIPLFICKYIY